MLGTSWFKSRESNLKKLYLLENKIEAFEKEAESASEALRSASYASPLCYDSASRFKGIVHNSKAYALDYKSALEGRRPEKKFSRSAFSRCRDSSAATTGGGTSTPVIRAASRNQRKSCDRARSPYASSHSMKLESTLGAPQESQASIPTTTSPKAVPSTTQGGVRPTPGGAAHTYVLNDSLSALEPRFYDDKLSSVVLRSTMSEAIKEGGRGFNIYEDLRYSPKYMDRGVKTPPRSRDIRTVRIPGAPEVSLSLPSSPTARNSDTRNLHHHSSPTNWDGSSVSPGTRQRVENSSPNSPYTPQRPSTCRPKGASRPSAVSASALHNVESSGRSPTSTPLDPASPNRVTSGQKALRDSVLDRRKKYSSTLNTEKPSFALTRGMVPLKEVFVLNKLYKKLDADDSGTVDVHEIKEHMEDLYATRMPDTLVSSIADLTNTQDLKFLDFLKLVYPNKKLEDLNWMSDSIKPPPKPPPPPPDVPDVELKLIFEMWKTWDLDKNGSLDVDEFTKGMYELTGESCALSEEEACELFSDIDTNADGVISEQEFLNWWCSSCVQLKDQALWVVPGEKMEKKSEPAA